MKFEFLHTIDHFSLLKQIHNNTNDILNKYTCNINNFINDNNISFVVNQYIYIPCTKNGVRIDKSLRLKVGGAIYNKLMEAGNGKLPKSIIENNGNI